MAKKHNYIKSKSIYTIKDLHTKTSGGTVYEHDHITIVQNDDIFNDEMTLFSDSNFKFKVRTEDGGKKKHTNNTWVAPDGSDNEFWTLNNLTSSDVSEETRIVNKPNYSSLRDFAYYGSAVELIKATVRDIIMRFPGGIRYYGSNAPVVKINGTSYYYVSNEFEIDCWTKGSVSEALVDNPMRVLACSYKNYLKSDGSELSASDFNFNFYENSGCRGSIIGSGTCANNTLYIYLDNEGKKILTTTVSNKSGWIIRPKKEYIDKFWNEMDDFEKVLLNRDSYPIYEAVFETPFFTDDGYFYENKHYRWPTVDNDGFTPDLTTTSFEAYLESLLSLARFHDEYDSDNIWRVMTHDSIKNLDWTFTSNNGEEVTETTDIDSTRQGAILRIYGRLFDDIKRSADNIKYNNSISYDEKNNIPDYFLSDVIDNDGWEAKNVIDFGTSGYTGDSISHSSNSVSTYIYTNSGKTEAYINSLFQRRLALSSTYLQTMKGTRKGLEAILGMFGYSSTSGTTGNAGEYKIEEYIVEVDGNIDDGTWPLECSAATLRNQFEYAYESENTNLMWGYPVASVKPSEENKENYLIPWYNKDVKYSNKNFYFQSKGGWGKMQDKEIKLPTEITNLTAITGNDIYRESSSYMLFVKDIESMKSIPYFRLFDGIVCYVEDISNINTEYVLGSKDEGDDYSHYFILENTDLSFCAGELTNNCYGWYNIKTTEYNNATDLTNYGKKVLYLESIKPQSRGNNPHNGLGRYDDGKNYFNYYKQIFYDAIVSGRIDEVPEGEDTEDDNYRIREKIKQLGFKLVGPNVVNKKCYYFGNVLLSGATSAGYESNITFNNPEDGKKDRSEAAANTIINTKWLSIKFFTGNNVEFKRYIKDVVLTYLEEMIPSTSIVEYLFDNETTSFSLPNNNASILSMAGFDTNDSTTYYGEDDSFYNKNRN